MSDEYGSDFITVTDQDGNTYELEQLDSMEVGEETYMAFLPADMDEDDEEYGIVIMKIVYEDGEEIFSTLDDDDEANRIYELFMERLFEDEE